MKIPTNLRELLRRIQREPVGAALASLAGDSTVYMAGGLLIGLGNIVLVPLYTRYLSRSQFGVYALLDVAVLLVVAVTQFKFDVAYLKWFAEVDTSRQGVLLGSVLMAGGLAAIVGGLALSVFLLGRSAELWLHTPTRMFAWLICPVVILENLQGLLLADLRARRRAVAYSMSAGFRLLVLVGVSYDLLVLRHGGISAVFAGRLIADAAGVLVLVGLCVRSIEWSFVGSPLKAMLRFGLPVVWCSFMVAMQDASGRYFLSTHGSLDQVGLLAAAIKIGAVFQVLVASPFTVAWGGMLFQIVKRPEGRVVYSKIFAYLFALTMGLGLVLSILGPALFHIFTPPTFYPAIAVLPLVLLVRVANIQEQPASTGIYLAGRTDLFAYLYTAALAVNIVALYFFVPKYGVDGVGWAWLLGSALVPISMAVVGQKFYHLIYNWRFLIVPAVPWVFVLWRNWQVPTKLTPGYVLLEIVMGAAILTGSGLLMAYDFWSLRKAPGRPTPVLRWNRRWS